MLFLKSIKLDSIILLNLGIIWKWVENIYINFIIIVFIRLNILFSEFYSGYKWFWEGCVIIFYF